MAKIAVLGAGNGGYTCSADLSLRGHQVNLFELPKFSKNIDPILQRGGIEISGATEEGFAKLNKVTTEIKGAVKGTDVVLIVVPAFGHDVFAEILIPHLENGQTVIYFGKGGGSLTFLKRLREFRVRKDIVLGETNTLPYMTRVIGPAQVKVFIRVKEILAAALPAVNNGKLVKILKELYPSTSLAANVLETILDDINAVLHPVPMILNAGRVEDPSSEFLIYKDGVTQSTENVYKSIDEERLAIKKLLGLTQTLFKDLYTRVGFGPEKEKLIEAVKCIYGGDKIKAASTLQHRYITEDVPYGLVTMASLGHLVNSPTPVIRSLITLASVINQVDYWKEGRTLEKLGVGDLNAEELIRFVNEG